MGRMNTRNNYLKYVAIALGAVFLIAAAFLLLTLWENRNGSVTVPGAMEDIVTYEGREYLRNDQVETFLVLGLDRYEGETSAESHESGVQTDFLMLLVFDHETKQSTAVHINRDSMTKVNKLAIGGTAVIESYTKQIALAYNYVNDDNDKIRCRNTVDSVEHLLGGVEVDHYFAVTMDAVAASCDLIGGVEVTVLDDFTGVDDTLVKGETVTLKGEHALRYVRSRYGLEDSSNSTRMARQQQYIEAFYEKALSRIEADEGFLIKLVDAVDDYVVYDSSDRKMQKFAEQFGNYEFLGIREIEGESKLGDEFLEFYVDEASAREIVIDLFYTPKTNGDE